MNPTLLNFFFKKGGGGEGGSDVSHKNREVGKIGEAVLKKGGGITNFHISMKISDSWLTNLFLSVWCVCVCVFCLLIYTISISIVCVSQEETSLIAFN